MNERATANTRHEASGLYHRSAGRDVRSRQREGRAHNGPRESCAPWTDTRHASLHSVEGWFFGRRGLLNPREEEETGAEPTAGAARKGNGARGTRSRSQQTTCRSFPRSYPAISAEKQRGFHRAALAGACLDGPCQLSRGCYHGVSKLPPYDAMDEFEGQGGCWLCLSY